MGYENVYKGWDWACQICNIWYIQTGSRNGIPLLKYDNIETKRRL